MQFVVGMDKGFSGKADAALVKMKEAGVTSVETYVLWRDVEGREEGNFDFSLFDEDLASLKRRSLKWVPFVVMGPWYSTPEWFIRSSKSVPSVCLEHNRAGGNQSIWSPFLREQVKRLLAAFRERYEGEESIESVLIGISGDYGEAIQTVYGNWPGEYHGHRGYWAGDPYAVESFRNFLLYHYGSLSGINAAWETAYSWEEVRPFIPQRPYAPSARAASDFFKWYRESMTSWADWWLSNLDGWEWDAYLVTGGIDEPEHASSFAQQCKVAAKHGRGVRITNEGSDYATNFMLTRLVSTASRTYGCYFSTEPASYVDERGEVGRAFNAYSSGARAMHEYFYNLFSDLEGTERPNLSALPPDLLRRAGDHKTTTEVGLVISQNARDMGTSWFGSEQLEASRKIREITDFDLLNEDLLRDGAERYRFLLFPYETALDDDVLRRLEEWVGSGGTAIVSSIPADLYGDRSAFSSLLGIREEVTGISQVRPITPLGSSGTVSRAYRVEGAQLHAVMTYKEEDQKAVVWSRCEGSGALVGVSTPPSSQIFLNALRGALYGSLEGVRPIEKPYDPIPIEGVYPARTSDRLLVYNSRGDAVTISAPTGRVVVGPNSVYVSG
ncbi:family 14 glycosylhydrolase [Tardisphaera saccharovorans]